MKGLALARAYYEDLGKPLLAQCFPDRIGRIAAGLAGPGSECFGFDDELSRDHDWGPAFCLWVTDEDHRAFGSRLQQTYLSLPGEYLVFGPRRPSSGEEHRVGVSTIRDFYSRYTGLDRLPRTLHEWLRIPEQALATCTNGEVFDDPLGMFTDTRRALLAYYPEDVRLKKIASRCLSIAQAGQCNYERSWRRGEQVAAGAAEARFTADVISLAFLLNRRYTPFYKWMHRAVRELPLLGPDVHRLLSDLSAAAGGKGKVEVIGKVTRLLAEKLRSAGLSGSASDFLLDHAGEVLARIRDPDLRAELRVVS